MEIAAFGGDLSHLKIRRSENRKARRPGAETIMTMSAHNIFTRAGINSRLLAIQWIESEAPLSVSARLASAPCRRWNPVPALLGYGCGPVRKTTALANATKPTTATPAPLEFSAGDTPMHPGRGRSLVQSSSAVCQGSIMRPVHKSHLMASSTTGPPREPVRISCRHSCRRLCLAGPSSSQTAG